MPLEPVRRHMPNTHNIPLIIAAALSAAAATLHVGIIINGASWYRFFGAGEQMAKAAEAGLWYPTIVTAAIAIILAIWSAYALSGAGIIPAAPLLKPVLCAISMVYLLRGLVLIPVLILPRGPATTFGIVSSAICLVFAAAHLLGLAQTWSNLKAQ